VAEKADKRRTVEEVIAQINKELGPETVVWGSQIRYSSLPRISTGSFSLDMALGGGWQTNAWHEIYGNESAGRPPSS